MNSIDFFKAFFFELINEVEAPIVTYNGYASVVERDYGPAGYLAHSIVSFNGQNSIKDYKQKIETIRENIIQRLEQEIYENPSWMINFNHNEILEELHKLKSSISSTEKPFIKIRFVNIGMSEVYDPIDGGYLHTEIKDAATGMSKFKTQLDEYSELLKSQIDTLYAKLNIIFSKFLYNKDVYLDNAKKTINASNIQELKKCIRENNISECLNKLSILFSENEALSNQVLMIERRFNANRQNKKSDIISLDEFQTTESKITHNILELISSQEM